MLQLRLLSVGRLKERYWELAQKEYQKRLSRYVKLELVEVDEERCHETNVADRLRTQEKEGERVLAKIRLDDFVVLLERSGQMLDSEAFAAQLEQWQLGHSRFVLVLGGSYGVSNAVKQRANFQWSYGPQTFPHQMMRVMVLEQWYRACKIMAKEPYHK